MSYQKPNLEEIYPEFVSYATYQAQIQLDGLLAKWKVEPTRDILDDAARFGCQMAREKFFPEATSLPFDKDPLTGIIKALLGIYEKKPEAVLPSADDFADPAESSEFVMLPDDDEDAPAPGPQDGTEQPRASSDEYRMAAPGGIPLETTMKTVSRPTGFPFAAKRRF